MTAAAEKYKTYSRRIGKLLEISGIWPVCSKRKHFAQRFLPIFALSTVSVTFLGALNFCLKHLSNIPVVTKHLGIVAGLLSTILKICTFLLHRSDIQELNNELSAIFESDLRNKLHEQLALTYVSSFANLFYALTSSVAIISLTTSIMKPLLALRYSAYVPVVPAIYSSFSLEPGSSMYWLIQLVNVAATFFVFTVTCGVDSLFGLYTLQMCGELRILGDKFEKLRSCKRYRRDLRRCVRRHNLLVRSRDKLEKVFGMLSVWLAVTSAVIQCTFIFQVVQGVKSANFANILYIGVYILVKLVQAFMYAWYGNLITEESKKCLVSIYNSTWPLSDDKKFPRDVLFVLLQKPLVFNAKGCMFVKMEMFSRIVQTSVSYFFLLRTLNHET